MTNKDTQFSKDNQPSDGNRKEGRAKRKVLTEALMIALNREVDNAEGKPTKRITVIADQLVKKAADGDLPAIKEAWDRAEGKAAQTIDQTLSNTDGSPIFMWGMGCPPKSE